MNVYTVAKASQGLADYVIKNFAPEKRKIAVSFDSRIKSDVFAKVASGVFAANGIKVEIYSELMPTPCLSFAVRYLGCAAGVMVTASHNPAKYNGYKVYGADGCQITTEAAAEILAEIEKLDIFDDVKRISFEEGFEAGKISYISEEVYTAFVEAVKKESVLGDTQVNKDVAIVYQDRIYFILFGILYASRCNNFHGNVAARMNSINADRETFKMYTDIFLVEYIILAIHMNCRGQLSDQVLERMKSNSEIML